MEAIRPESKGSHDILRRAMPGIQHGHHGLATLDRVESTGGHCYMKAVRYCVGIEKEYRNPRRDDDRVRQFLSTGVPVVGPLEDLGAQVARPSDAHVILDKHLCRLWCIPIFYGGMGQLELGQVVSQS